MTAVKAQVIAASAAVLLARVTKNTGANIVQADVSTITSKVWDTESGLQIGSTMTPSVASTVFNTLQTDSRWNVDAIGYNFALEVPGSYWPVGKTHYRAEIKVTPTTGNAFYLLFDLQAIKIFSE